MHQVVTAQLAAARAGTHSTKTRAEVAGGGAKPWRQKGTGRARQGSIRAPHWRGGGVAHGPKPRDYTQRTPKKMVRLALRSARSPTGPSEAKVARRRRLGLRRRPSTKDAHRGARRARPAHRRASATPRVLLVLDRTDETRVEVVPQPRRPGADHPARGAQRLRRARQRLARLHAGDARHDRRPPRPERDGPTRGAATERRRDAEDRRRRMSAQTPATSSSGRSCRRSRTPRFDANVYTFEVAPDANKIQIKHAVEEIFGVHGHQREHAEPARASASATAAPAPGASAPTRSGRSSRSPTATASRSSGADDADSQAQAHQPRSPVPDASRTSPRSPRTSPSSRSSSRSRAPAAATPTAA